VPDGLLLRISSIDDDESRAYEIEEKFIREMLGAMAPTDRTRVTGEIGP
jgi:hypothetical protein